MSAEHEDPLHFIVAAEHHDQRIDKFLSSVLEDTTRTQVQKQITRDAVLINQKSATERAPNPSKTWRYRKLHKATTRAH